MDCVLGHFSVMNPPVQRPPLSPASDHACALPDPSKKTLNSMKTSVDVLNNGLTPLFKELLNKLEETNLKL
jgi:hypothetical protein